MLTAEHTVKAFDVDLQELARMIAEMGGLVERQLVEAVDALSRRDRERGRRVVLGDNAVDAHQRAIEQKAVAIIATRQPVAVDLRAIVGVLRIAGDIERIGDLAKNIAKRVIALNDATMPRRSLGGVSHMMTLALGQFRDALDSFAGRDSRKALKIRSRDEEIDRIYTSLFRELVVHMMEDPGVIAFGLHLLFCAKNLERVGDHAANIAETVYYMVEGRPFTVPMVPEARALAASAPPPLDLQTAK
jgi:phosphate transport system protein